MKLRNVLPKARALSTLGERKLLRLWELVQETESVPGIVLEVGVYKGGSAWILANATGKRVVLCDTFAGTPNCPVHELDDHGPGSWAVSPQGVAELLAPLGPRVEVVIGEYSETFGAEDEQIAFAHIDVDLYHWTGAVLADVWGKLSVGGIVVCDDYDCKTTRGAKLAIDEFLAGVTDAETEQGAESQLIIRKVRSSAPKRKPRDKETTGRGEAEAQEAEVPEIGADIAVEQAEAGAEVETPCVGSHCAMPEQD